MTLQETLKWDEYPVQIVALVAISQDEAKEFNDFLKCLSKSFLIRSMCDC